MAHHIAGRGIYHEWAMMKRIFLILREHLGDENLDLAGGVLYELIEVDCEHTDDPGAAFQRWRHDHMCRYTDLELPHVPHMTTITSSIIPTGRLSQWRLTHPERYPFVLSDSSPIVRDFSIDRSCIRNRKAWLIDHTFFVTSRSDGTRPMRSPNPQEFHAMQWDAEYGSGGRLVEERDIRLDSSGRPSEVSPPGTADTLLAKTPHTKSLRHSLSSLSIISKFKRRLSGSKKQSVVEERRKSWIPGTLIFETASAFKDKSSGANPFSVPLPDGCKVPNAIFARKFCLVKREESLPPYLPISQMPTAEAKATDSLLEAVSGGISAEASPWRFRGPFTPQLGFDGGLDYQWRLHEPVMTIRRFDVENPVPEGPNFGPYGIDEVIQRRNKNEGLAARQRKLERRRGLVFGPDEAIRWRVDSLSSIPQTPTPRGRSKAFRWERFEKGTSLFHNIEFTVPAMADSFEETASNRKTTIIERSKASIYGSSPSCMLPDSGDLPLSHGELLHVEI
ncbi:hypothetical protein F4778DRAFT_771701 [Xylariomycetidae sp. FL2044]|nr:hypothetical protein F4778DRAFT_771701 [Xylariomycetidae sp. FL2044]